ncbi:MAG: hypothetical protein LBP59_11615 [Planctomycetaceae bacterium]|nr:hypothetical protein [Planctomycetaceae bacterium]
MRYEFIRRSSPESQIKINLTTILTVKNTMKKLLRLVSPLICLLSFCTAALIVPQDAVHAAKLLRLRRFNSKWQVAQLDQSSQNNLAVTIAKLKSNPIEPQQSDLNRCKKLLLNECNSLIKILEADPNREAAEKWRKELRLDLLRDRLLESGLPEIELIRDAWQDFIQDKTGLRWELFNGVRDELRRYQTVYALLELGKEYSVQVVKVCDSFDNMLQKYIQTASPVVGATLNDQIVWFNDISIFDKRAAYIASAAVKLVATSNIKFTVNNYFMSNGFSRELARDIEVDETIQGTRLIGSGSMTGTSSSAIVTRSKGGAAIDVIIDANMETETTGYHSPVTLNTRTTGALAGKKRVLLTPDKISALPATSTADLQADIYNVRVNAGALVSCIARRQVEAQREDSLAEAKLRAEERLNDQIDAIVDAEIADANEQYQKSFRRPLKNFGLLSEFDISSFAADADKNLSGGINGRAIVGTPFQPCSATNPPDIKNTYDVYVQIHQSLPNNVAAFALAGKNYDESESNLTDQLGDLESLRQFLERKEGQDPIAIRFASKAPFVITFEEDVVKVVVRTNGFSQNGSRYPGLDITLAYKVKVEDVGGGNYAVVLEQAEKPDAMPRGKTTVSAREQTIRTVVIRRLEAAPKRVVLKPFGLKWKGWQGGELKPVFAKSTNGWLTIGFNWIKNNNKQLTAKNDNKE